MAIREATCCIVGSGPAGAMLGLLLARAGIEVVVLEKHGDFLRDFRGDTIHPSTMELLDQLRLTDKFFQLRHTKVDALEVETPSGPVTAADFRRLHTRYPFLAFVPQWDFLDLITNAARQYPSFHLTMNAEAMDVIKDDGVVSGVRYEHDGQLTRIRSSLTVAADGRGSQIRERSGLVPESISPPMDVLWFRIPRKDREPEKLTLMIGSGHILLFINRFEYWQVAYSIPKGGADVLRSRGLAAFKTHLADLKPELGDRFMEISDWDQIKLLTVQSNRLPRWHLPGLLLIGDAAHAMSPMGGVGINLAIQDAVAAANIVTGPLRAGTLSEGDLHRVQRRRWLPTVVIQSLQRAMDRTVVAPALAGRQAVNPRFFTLLRRAPVLSGLPARLIGLGVRRERIVP